MKRPSNDKLIMWGLAFITLAGLTVCFLHHEYSLASVFSSIKTADPMWLLPGIAAMGLFFICEGANIGRCLRLSGHNITRRAEISYALIGFFFSSITPSATGGQPMQIYFMHKDGLPLSHSSLALLTELTSFQAAAAALAMAGLIGMRRPIFGEGAADGTVTAAILAAGVIINAAILAVLLFMIFSPTAPRIVASPVVWLFDRINMRNGAAIRFKLLRGICEYRRAAGYITKNPPAMAEIFLTSLIQLLSYFSITFCVCKSLGIPNISWLALTLNQAALYVSVSALPLPGAVGVTEGGFALLFAALIPTKLMGVAIILSRFVSFALPLVASGIGSLLLGGMPERDS